MVLWVMVFITRVGYQRRVPKERLKRFIKLISWKNIYSFLLFRVFINKVQLSTKNKKDFFLLFTAKVH